MSEHALLGAPRPRPEGLISLEALTKRWLDEGIITAEQAALMQQRGGCDVVLPSSQPVSSSRSSLAAEALGYLGGVIVVVASLLLAARYWDEISTTGRLSLVGGTAVVLVVAGFAVPRRTGAVGERLRAVLWMAATAAVAGFLGLLGNDVLELSDAQDVFLMTAAGTALTAAWLWSVSRSLVQQVVLAVAVMATAAAALADFVATDGLPGVGVWIVAATWGLLGWSGRLGPRRAVQSLAAAGMVFGAMLTMPHDAGIVLSLSTAALLVLMSVLLRDLILLAIGAVGALQVLPIMVNEWFPDSVAAPLILLAVGALLVALAIRITRHGAQSG